jgi:hypothetical protein
MHGMEHARDLERIRVVFGMAEAGHGLHVVEVGAGAEYVATSSHNHHAGFR